MIDRTEGKCPLCLLPVSTEDNLLSDRVTFRHGDDEISITSLEAATLPLSRGNSDPPQMWMPKHKFADLQVVEDWFENLHKPSYERD